jgi:predicted trehalose synthase
MATTAAHPIGGAVARVHSALDDVAGTPLWSMSQAATAQTLVEISRVEARLVEVRSQLLSHAETVAVAETNASPSVAVWHSNATRSTKRESFRQVAWRRIWIGTTWCGKRSAVAMSSRSRRR